jgi:dolichol-phosphate mannosyltransferase
LRKTIDRCIPAADGLRETSTLVTDPPAADAPDVSIIVPALNEGENIPLLLPRLAAAMNGRSYEVLIVDDASRDRTPQVCDELSKTYPLKLLVREHPKYGLSGAVLHGIAAARGRTLVVMDADLQHPPERVPALLEALDDSANGVDFALGSRYVPGGSTDDRWTLFRKINSWVATFLARPFAGNVRDPMSGFFALRRSTFDRAQRLTPLGYKIALELMCKCRVRNVREIPIHFGLRTKGESKLTLKQQFKYLEHLSRLYDFTFPRASPISKFSIATIMGLIVGLGVFIALSSTGSGRIAATIWGYFFSILVTAVFHVRYVRTQREFLLTQHPWIHFTVISGAEWLAAILSVWWLARRATAASGVEVFLISFGCATVVRYALRKEFLEDVRGLRKEIRPEELL